MHTASKALTEVIELPSKGWYYPEGHPLASGKLDIYLMTARHEDILTSTNLIRKGLVLDRLMEELIADPTVTYDDLLIGDKNALMIASRILGYGSQYTVNVTCPECEAKQEATVNLADLQDKPLMFDENRRHINEFEFTLPLSKKLVVFKLLTHKDEKSIETELATTKLANNGITQEVTTRMRYAIKSINGITGGEALRTEINNMPARDGMAFREYTKTINPDIDLVFSFACESCEHVEPRMEVPIDVTFFWPNVRV